MSEIKEIDIDRDTSIEESFGTAQHSTAQIVVLADLYEENGHKSAGGRIYSSDGIAPSMGASHFAQIKYVVEVRKVNESK